MRVLIDTNILLDFLLQREPFRQDAEELFQAIDSGQIIGYVTATTLTDIITGISVECAVGLSVTELAVAIPHGQVGVTTVGEFRSWDGDVIRTSGRSPNHATLTGLTAEQVSKSSANTNDS